MKYVTFSIVFPFPEKSVFQSLINKAVQVLLRNINTGAMKVTLIKVLFVIYNL